MEGKLNYEHAVQLLRKAFTIIDALLIHLLRVYLLLECKDTFNLFRILQAVYIFLSNITVVIEQDDNFDKSSQVFSFDTIIAIGNITINQNIEISPNLTHHSHQTTLILV